MNTRARLAVIASFAAVPLALAAPASAHTINVTTPSGVEQSQFHGGPGNPGHPGHAHGHTTACAGADGSGVVDFAGGGC